MKKFIFILMLSFLACTSSYASVATDEIRDLGLIGTGNTYFDNSFETGLTFTDYFQFTIPRADLAAGVMALNFDTDYRITNFKFRFFDDIAFSSEITPDVSKGKSYSFYDLAAGTYFFLVSGKTGVDGGEYFGKLSATPVPVPIPGAALLLGSALLGVVGIRRTRTV